MVGPGWGAWWGFWQLDRKPSGGGWGILGPEGEASLAYHAPGSVATRRTPEASWALAQCVLEFSSGVLQLSSMERPVSAF